MAKRGVKQKFLWNLTHLEPQASEFYTDDAVPSPHSPVNGSAARRTTAPAVAGTADDLLQAAVDPRRLTSVRWKPAELAPAPSGARAGVTGRSAHRAAFAVASP